MSFSAAISCPVSSVLSTVIRLVRSPDATARATRTASLIGPVMLRVMSTAHTAASTTAMAPSAIIILRPLA